MFMSREKTNAGQNYNIKIGSSPKSFKSVEKLKYLS